MRFKLLKREPAVTATGGPTASKQRKIRTYREYRPAAPPPLMMRGYGPPGPRDWHLYAVQLRALIDAGFPIIQAMHVHADAVRNESQRKATRRVAELLARGIPLRTALEDQQKRLPPLVRGLMLLGESAGDLGRTLDVVAKHYAWMFEIRRLMLSLVWYPLILVFLGSLVNYTRDVILATIHGMSTEAAMLICFRYDIAPVIAASVAGAITAFFLRWGKLAWVVDEIILHMPFMSTVSRRYSTAVFLSVLATTLEAGMTPPVGYELSADTMPNQALAKRLRKWTHFLRDGEPIAVTLRKTGVFEKDALGMITAGEIGAAAPSLMRRIAAYYDDVVRNTVKVTIRLLAPLFVLMVAAGFFLCPAVLSLLAFILVLLICL